MLTQEIVDKLSHLGRDFNNKLKDKYPSGRFAHGFVFGLDGLHDPTHKEPFLQTADQDLSTYHIIIKEEADSNPFKDAITGKITEGVHKLSSNDPLEIGKFIQQHIDKDFKF